MSGHVWRVRGLIAMVVIGIPACMLVWQPQSVSVVMDQPQHQRHRSFAMDMHTDWTNLTDMQFMKLLYTSLPGAQTLQQFCGDHEKKCNDNAWKNRNRMIYEIWPETIQKHFDFDQVDVGIKSRFTSIVAGVKQRFPSALIIGVRKGGTRALINFLMLHSQVSSPSNEQHFFTSWHRGGLSKFEEAMNKYKKWMSYSFPDQITIEKTPQYIRSGVAAERVGEYLPQTKVIAIMRNPVSRLISDYAQVVGGDEHIPTFHNVAFNKKKEVTVERYKVDIVGFSLYDKQIAHWLKHIPREQFHFVTTDGLYRDTVGVLKGIERFLGLRGELSKSSMFQDANNYTCYVDDPFLKGSFCLGEGKHRAHTYVSEEDRKKLAEFYEPHMKKFDKLIGKNLNLLNVL